MRSIFIKYCPTFESGSNFLNVIDLSIWSIGSKVALVTLRVILSLFGVGTVASRFVGLTILLTEQLSRFRVYCDN